MNINIYYGGRGIIDDPTLYVLNKMQNVLEELRVNVTRYNLYEHKNEIVTLPQTLKGADGIILAATVEWFGYGGYLQQFLDACWLFGDKETIAGMYMFPLVMSVAYGEREAKTNLTIAWEILGGRPFGGLCGYIENTLILETSEEYNQLIEKKAENLYRSINQRVVKLPASNHAVRQKISSPKENDLTPQETEQLSQYVSDDSYVQRQKEDILELTSLFRDKISNEGADSEEEFLAELKAAFHPLPGFSAVYAVVIEEKPHPLTIRVQGANLECAYEICEDAEVEMQLTRAAMDDIVRGRKTFQGSFMTGAMKTKGEFRILRSLDRLFVFGEGQKEQP